MYRTLAAAVAVVGFAVPSTAAAGTMTVNFDALPDGSALAPGTYLDRQYPGVRFPNRPQVRRTSFAFSGMQVAAPRDYCHEIDCPNPDYTTFRATFDEPQQVVSLRTGRAGYPEQNGPAWARLLAYSGPDGTGSVVAGTDDVRLEGDRLDVLLEARSFAGRPDIRSVVLYNGGRQTTHQGYPYTATVDDLTFGIPDAPAPPPPPPPPPTVALTAPDEDAQLQTSTEVVAAGRVDAPAGLLAFCVVVDRPDAFPQDCSSQTGAINTDGTFSGLVPTGGVSPGTHRITAWVKDLRDRTAAATRTVTVAATGNRLVDLAAVGLEVTQGVQAFNLPFAGPSRADRTQTYAGVRLAEAFPTIVRLYALSAGSLARVRGATAALYGFRQGRNGRVALNGGRPLLPLRGPAEVGRFALNDEIRGDGAASFDFSLPATWTQGVVTLRAEINPSALAPAVTECGACRVNNVAELRNVGFEPTGEVQITPVALPDDFNHPVPDVGRAFAGLRAVLPISPGKLRIAPYQGAIAIGDIKARLAGYDERTGPVFDRLAQWEDRNQAPGFTVGVTSGDVRGLAAPVVFAPGIIPPRLGGIETLAVTEANRPLTSVAHEVFHQLGFRHAGFGCDDGSFRQILTEGWPPDEKGFIAGVGLDRRTGPSALHPQNPFRVLLPSPATIRAQSGTADFFDLMSYCANENNAWISVKSWNRAIRGPRLSQEIGLARAAAGRRDGPTLRILARVDRQTGATAIVSVGRGAGGVTPPAVEGDVEVVTRAGDGSITGRTLVRTQAGHVHGTAQQDDVITADVPATGVAAVEIVRGGQTVARRSASATAPAVALIAPRPGTSIARGRFVDVSWSASDPDGDPLEAAIAYSRDNGRTFRPLTLAIHGNSAKLPASLFSGSRAGRLRVTISDGFRESSATSGPLRVAEQAPDVRILSPSTPAAIAADATLALTGEAYDAEGRPLASSRLRWYQGPRPIGRGRSVAVSGLRAGRGRLSLVARGAGGTSGTASMPLRVIAAKPRFLALRAPRHLRTNSRRVRIQVASTVAARLTARGRTTAVDQRPRVVAIPIRPGGRALRLTLTLRSARLVTRLTITIPRR